MEINPINNIAGINLKSLKKSTEPEPQKSVDKSENLIKELDKMSMINNVNIGKKDYELNLSMEELEKRTQKLADTDVTVEFNRPFMFVILDNESDIPLYMGTYTG